MIKFDKDVLNALQTLEREDFETYAAGECVRETLRGEKVYDWDLLTRASLADMQRIFPQGKVVSREKQILRVDFTYETEEKNGETILEGSIADFKYFEGAIEDVLREMPFSVDAIADSPIRGLKDPCGCRADMEASLIRTNGNAGELFRGKPVLMMSAIRIVSETGYDLHKDVYEAICKNWDLVNRQIEEGNPAPVRRELERIVSGANAGKALKMLSGTGLLKAVWGTSIVSRFSRADDFRRLCANIDKTRQVPLRRLGLLYTVLPEKKALAAMNRMQFEGEDRMHLEDGIKKVIDINFLNNDTEMKKFLSEYGFDRYNYIHDLSKAVRIVYDQSPHKIEARNYMMNQILSLHEPVFVEDLVIDANDLMEEGLADTPEAAEALLFKLLAPVHKNRANNRRDVLLKQAKKYAKSKFASKTRYITWSR